jgi:hypothetical protein
MNVSSASSSAYQAADAQAASKKPPVQNAPSAAPAAASAPTDSDGDHDGSNGKLDVRA